MLNRKSAKPHTADHDGFVRRHITPVTNWKSIEQGPRRFRRIDGARRALRQAPGMISMGMRQHNRRRRDRLQQAQPVLAAIDHDAGVAGPDKRRAVTPMLARPDVDLTACPEKSQVSRRGDSPSSVAAESMTRRIINGSGSCPALGLLCCVAPKCAGDRLAEISFQTTARPRNTLQAFEQSNLFRRRLFLVPPCRPI